MQLLSNFTLNELTEFLTTDYNVKPFVAKQVYQWLTRGADFDQMTNVSKDLREKLKQNCVAIGVKIVQTLTSAIDGTQKFLFELSDGNVVEGVLMKYKYGNTLCVSTQVGCRMGCKFCASTLGGLVRNMEAGEILGEVLAVNALGTSAEKGRYVTNVVLMGSGEPLDNYDNVTKFLRLLTSPEGLNVSERNVSLSTCGLVPKIKQLADDGFTLNLTVSLHNADDEKRREIMPVANSYSVAEVCDAARYYFEKTGRRVLFEYTLIDGQNDSYASALKLASAVRGMSSHVNLIRLNSVKETGLHGTSDEAIKKFLGYLEKLGVSATLRRSLGADINGACGQLRRKYMEKNG